MLGLLLAEEIAEVTMPSQHRFFDLFTRSDLVIQGTLLLIIFLSVTSWAIIGMKYRQMKRAKARSEKFVSTFKNSDSIDSLLKKGSFLRSPTFRIFKSAVAVLRDQTNGKSKTRVSYAIDTAMENEVGELESYVPFLAMTSSAAPFIGLFGTVWGILQAFWKLGGAAGGSSMEIVGPHIAEALSATAFGLAAAIPAVIFYNYFVSHIRLITRNMQQFSGDLMNRIEDEYLK